MKFPKRICKTCGEEFMPSSEKNVFCSRKCFKKDYYHRKKAEELISRSIFPIFKCPSCKQIINLDFNPVVDAYKWSHFICPGCNTLMINVSDGIITDDSPIV